MKHTLTKRSTFFIYIGLVDETYINKEKHFFISDTRVEQVANEVYRASQGWRPGVIRLGC